MRVRPAAVSDAELLYAWRNDPETRRQSRTADVVPWDEHIRWLEGVIASPNRLLLVGEDERGPVGTVRFEVDEGRAEISVTVGPERRGKGHAVPLIRLACSWIRVPIDAFIRRDNVASIRAFERAGFRLAGQEREMICYTLDPEMSGPRNGGSDLS